MTGRTHVPGRTCFHLKTWDNILCSYLKMISVSSMREAASSSRKKRPTPCRYSHQPNHHHQEEVDAKSIFACFQKLGVPAMIIAPGQAWRVLCKEHWGRLCWPGCLAPKLEPGGEFQHSKLNIQGGLAKKNAPFRINTAIRVLQDFPFIGALFTGTNTKRQCNFKHDWFKFISGISKWLDALRGSSPARCNNGT